MSDPVAERVRDLILAAVENIDPNAALFLSGGVDSATLLAASIARGEI